MNTQKQICQRVNDAGGKAYYVGGCVRDWELGRVPDDIDIVVIGINMEQLANIFPNGEVVGKGFPIMIVEGVEVALARKERKTGVGHTEFVCEIENVTLEEDLSRRDFTINAMAKDPFTDKIIDPYGGQNDLKIGVLRPIGPQFAEDPLRILRAARFCAKLDMRLSDELIDMAHNVLHELVNLPGERVFGELEKALRTQRPSLFFEALNELGALEIVFPEIAALQARVQPEKHHPEGDAYVHTLLVVDRARELGADDVTMFAALCHDLGKAVTDDDNMPHHYNHEALGVPLVHQLCDRIKAPNDCRELAAIVAREHLNVHRFNDLKPTTKVRMLTRIGAIHNEKTVERLGLAAQADAQGRGPTFINREYPQRQAMLDATRAIREVRGDQFAHLKDGEKIKQRLEQARAKVLK